jgi:MFS family permease
VIPRAHAAFSAAVVVTSLGTGGLVALGAPLVAPFAAVALVAVAVAVTVTRWDLPVPRPEPLGAPHPDGGRPGVPRGPVLALGGLAALAFAVENGHQSWSALYLRDVLEAGPATAAAGPALFAGVVAAVRLTAGGLSTRRPTLVLLAGSGAAALGTAGVGVAPTIVTALLALGLAAAGTAVLFPTLLGVLTAHVPDHARGRATSTLTVVAYLGFLAGPVYVGRLADAADLPTAMLALGGLGVVLAVLVRPGLRLLPPGRARRRPDPQPGAVPAVRRPGQPA